MATIEEVRDLLGTETGLVTVSTLRADGTPVLTVVNAGVIDHPVSGAPSVAFVALGSSNKLNQLRERPFVSVMVRRGWRWVVAEGAPDLIGPDDPFQGFDANGVPGLIRSIYAAAGGQHDDWEEFDRVMKAERRCAVVVAPAKIYTNPNRPV